MILAVTFTITGAILRYLATSVISLCVGGYVMYRYAKKSLTAKQQSQIDAAISAIEKPVEKLSADKQAIVDALNSLKPK